MLDVAYMITESPSAHGVFDTRTSTERKVTVLVQSVTRSEYYNAHNAGFQPELVLKLIRQSEYAGEKLLKFHNLKYDIIRTYVTNDGGLEMTIQRGDANA